MAKDVGDVITLMRRIIGENDGNDPDATDSVLLSYVSDFYNLLMPQDIRVNELFSWFEFDTVDGQDVYPFKDQGYSNIYPPVYAIDSNNADTIVDFYQNPLDFYEIHPISKEEEQEGRPFSLLFYNDEILLRPTPDTVYTIRIKAYRELTVSNQNDDIDQDYWFRYIAYGASLDYLSDFGNVEEYQKIFPAYDRYRKLVAMRRAKQETTQRARPAL